MLTDLAVHPRPALPAPPSKGERYTDPVFGSQILRVSDESDGISNTTAYSYWPSFNCNGTKLLVFCDQVPKVASFDAKTFSVGPLEPLFDRDSPSGPLRWEELIWSGTQPLEVYGHAPDGSIWRYHLGMKCYKRACPGGGTPLLSWTKSIDDRVAAYGRDGQAFILALLNVDTAPLLARALPDGYLVRMAHLDQSGRYVLVKTTSGGDGFVYDRTYDRLTKVPNELPAAMPGHCDTGKGYVVGIEDQGGCLRRWSLASPLTPRLLLALKDVQGWWPPTADEHICCLMSSTTWALVDTYHFGTGWQDSLENGQSRPLEGEIFSVATDGSENVTRWCHHRSGGPDYWDGPHVTSSRDGKYAAYTSSWEGTLGDGRRDVFVVRTA